MLWDGLPSCIPLVLFAVLGFEAACSLSSKIENPEKNAPKAIVISFAAVIGIYCLYQFLAYAMLGDVANSLSGYKDFFAYLAHLISPVAYDKTMALLYCTIALSTLGGAYGILYSNMWNLHTLAQHKHIVYAPLFTSLNTHAMPTWCVIAEVSICLLYLFVSGGTALPLQQIAATSCAITYGISICALIAAKKNRSINFSWVLTLCGFINCLMLATLCVVYVLRGSHPALYVFVGLLISGVGMFLATKNPKE
jgi:amino acid transporter